MPSSGRKFFDEETTIYIIPYIELSRDLILRMVLQQFYSFLIKELTTCWWPNQERSKHV